MIVVVFTVTPLITPIQKIGQTFLFVKKKWMLLLWLTPLAYAINLHLKHLFTDSLI